MQQSHMSVQMFTIGCHKSAKLSQKLGKLSAFCLTQDNISRRNPAGSWKIAPPAANCKKDISKMLDTSLIPF